MRRFASILLSSLVVAATGCGDSHATKPDGGDGGGMVIPDGSFGSGVGQSCRPLGVPMGDLDGDGLNDGYRASEAYIETGTLMCGAGGEGCLIYHLDGDPRMECDPAESEC